MQLIKSRGVPLPHLLCPSSAASLIPPLSAIASRLFFLTSSSRACARLHHGAAPRESKENAREKVLNKIYIPDKSTKYFLSLSPSPTPLLYTHYIMNIPLKTKITCFMSARGHYVAQQQFFSTTRGSIQTSKRAHVKDFTCERNWPAGFSPQ